MIGNQTMEHWGENGCTLQWGLYQCFRVCKPGGKIMMNVPIHFHGTKEFMLGNVEEIINSFYNFSHTVNVEKWGYPSYPLPSLFPYPQYWKLKKKPAYVLNISSIKDRSLPVNVSNQGACKGRLAQLRNYPISYNIYRFCRKIGLFSEKHKQVYL